MKPLPLLVAASLLSLAVPSVAAADTPARPAESMTIDVELTESKSKKEAETLKVTLTLAGDRGCASVETSSSTLGYELTVCREGGDATSPVMAFSVKRSERTKDSSTFRKLSVASRMTAGKRVVVGKIARGETDSTEIAAQIQ